MFKLLFMITVTSPLALLIAASNSPPSIENTNFQNMTYEEVAEHRIETLNACRPTSISVDFNEEYIGMHASEYLVDAMQAVEGCKINVIEITQFEAKDAPQAHIQLSQNRADELTSILQIFYPSDSVIVKHDYVRWDVEMVENRPLSIKFDLGGYDISDS